MELVNKIFNKDLSFYDGYPISDYIKRDLLCQIAPAIQKDKTYLIKYVEEPFKEEPFNQNGNFNKGIILLENSDKTIVNDYIKIVAKEILDEVSKHYGGKWLVDLYKRYEIDDDIESDTQRINKILKGKYLGGKSNNG